MALSGLGGDELLGGYSSFVQVPSWHRWLRVGRFVPGLSAVWPRVARWLKPKTPKLRGLMRYGQTLPGTYLLRRGLFLPEELPALLGGSLAAAGLGTYDPVWAGHVILGRGRATLGWEAVQALETGLYLRNQLLRDSDWASMAHSVELRVPFVDSRLHRAASESRFALPRQAGKRGVARRLAPTLPASVFERSKTGFVIPAVEWMGGPRRVSAGSRDMALRVLQAFGLGLPAPAGY